MITYKEAGVNIEEGYKSVKLIKEYAQRTMSEYVLNGLGSFAGMVELPEGYKKPVLVSGTDGVGTKLELAFKTKKYDTVGIDCVAMCVNDILCHGAKPLFYLYLQYLLQILQYHILPLYKNLAFLLFLHQLKHNLT